MAAASIPIRLDDIDAAGVVFGPRLCAIAHAAYEDALAAAGLPLPALLAEGRWALPLVRIDAAFHAPLRHGDRVTPAITVEERQDTGCTVVVRLLAADGRPAATVRQTITCIALPERRRQPFPPPIKAALDRLGQDAR